MNNKFLKKLLQDRQTRKEATRLSHNLFFHVYFHNYVKYSTAEFQKNLLRMTEKENTREVFVIAFRGGGKSTILSHSYPIWAALGIQRKRFIIIISQTQNQAQQILSNIRRELEMNELIKKDYGPFTDGSGEWSNSALDIPKYGVKIIATSSGGSIRGIRHGSYRPDLIICDDVEDIASVKTLEGRDRTYQWFTSEVLPLGDVGTRVIVLGNMLHEDSLMMKLKDYDDKVGIYSVFLQYPLVNDDGQILWPEKYTKNDIENLRRSTMNPYTFEREYLLRIVPDEDRVVYKEWVHYYDNLPNPIEKPPRLIAIGVDLALSQKETADFTTMVPAYVTGYGKNLRIYILPHIVNKRLLHPDTLKEIKRLCDQLFHQFKLNPIVYVESVAYQASVVQQLTVEGIFSEPVYVSGLDKRSRLSITTPYIHAGRVLFPRHGAEGLVSQITNFGVEKHDDIADGYSAMMLKIIEGDHRTYDPLPGDPKPDIPIYREFAGEMINMSKPFFTMDMKF